MYTDTFWTPVEVLRNDFGTVRLVDSGKLTRITDKIYQYINSHKKGLFEANLKRLPNRLSWTVSSSQ